MSSVDAEVERELAQIEMAVARIRGQARSPEPPANDVSIDHDMHLCLLAEKLLRMRRAREELFGKTLFADPAWDMLLDLFVQRRHGRRISISSLCIAAAVPGTTALRHMAALEAAGLIVRYRAADDSRRRYVELTEDACGKLRTWLQGLARAAATARAQST